MSKFWRTRDGVEVPNMLTFERDGRTVLEIDGPRMEIDASFSPPGSVTLTPDEMEAAAMFMLVWSRVARQERG